MDTRSKEKGITFVLDNEQYQKYRYMAFQPALSEKSNNSNEPDAEPTDLCKITACRLSLFFKKAMSIKSAASCI